VTKIPAVLKQFHILSRQYQPPAESPQGEVLPSPGWLFEWNGKYFLAFSARRVPDFNLAPRLPWASKQSSAPRRPAGRYSNDSARPPTCSN